MHADERGSPAPKSEGALSAVMYLRESAFICG